MKKLSGIIVTIVICITMALGSNFPALAAETEGGFGYEITNNQVTITGYNGTGTELVIPATIENLPVTTIGDFAFSSCSTLKSIALPDGIKTIGECAFSDCSALKSIDLPESVSVISIDAFSGCNMESAYIRSKNCGFDDDSLFKTGAVIYGYGGSTAYDYAKTNGNVFRCIGEHEYTISSVKKASILSKTNGEINYTCKWCEDKKAPEIIAYPKTITLSASSYTYDGKVKTPGVTVIGSDGKVIPAQYYQVTYPEGRANADTYEIQITFTNISDYYIGTFYPTFKITQAAQTISGVKSSYTKTYSKKGSMTLKAAAKGAVTYTSGNTKVAKVNQTTGKVTFVGTGTAKITIKAAATNNYQAASKNVTIKVKMPQKITTKVKTTKTYKYSKLKKSKQTFQIGATTSGNGKLTYKVSKYPKNAKKYITVSTKGKVTLKKGAKKGTYKITVTAAETTKYNKTSKVITIKVK